MDSRIVARPRIVKPRALPEWDIILEQKKIGEVRQFRVGRSTSVFYNALVLVDGQLVDLELNIDFDERCDAVLAAHLDPMSNRHVRYWLGPKYSGDDH